MAVYTAIDNPELYFQTVLWTGNSSTLSVTLGGEEDMQPDFVWGKARSGPDAINNHGLYNSVIGATKTLRTNNDTYERTLTGGLTSFDSDGFSLGDEGIMNLDGNANVAWCWKESATSGFDIVSYTGTGSAKTESHSLSAIPHFMIVKNRTDADSWRVYHHKNTAAPETDYLVPDTDAATADDATAWNDTAPTSSVFSVGTSDQTNENTDSFIAYLWSEKQGFSKFGVYTGNGNADGAFIYTGFRPAFILHKCNSDAENWTIYDTKRDTFNVAEFLIRPNLNNPEDTFDTFDILSNGFKNRQADAQYNYLNRTYVYMAFAESPFMNSSGVPCNAR